MVYTVPSLAYLQAQCAKAHKILHTWMRRYIEPNFTELRQGCLQLKSCYIESVEAYNKNQWLGFKKVVNPVRLAQCDMIEHLAKHLLEDKPENRAVLLGALFYRLIRIKTQQSGGFFSNAAEDTTLYPLICKILKVPPHQPSIDDLTTYHCLDSFACYLKQEAVTQEFDYVQNDADFFSNLSTLIGSYRARSLPALLQVNHIDFVQSLNQQMNWVLDAASSWVDHLIHSIGRLKCVSKSSLMDQLSGCTLPGHTESASQSFGKKWLQDCWPHDETMSVDNAVLQGERLKGLLALKSKFTLLGGLYFTLQALEVKASDNMNAINSIKVILGCDANNPLLTKSDEEDSETIHTGLQFLQHFVDILGRDELDKHLQCQVWGGAAPLLQALDYTVNSLQIEETGTLGIA
ncbi:MAG: hypothetical protein JJT82_04425 [Legionellaceae bacterium]|nr:hypothetical protein [Legionellaceae bacterium]